jgi:hypothetical protein
MRRLLTYLLVLIGFLMTGCEQSEGNQRPNGYLSDGRPQLEVTVQQ